MKQACVLMEKNQLTRYLPNNRMLIIILIYNIFNRKMCKNVNNTIIILCRT